jgi:hypothetical protein
VPGNIQQPGSEGSETRFEIRVLFGAETLVVEMPTVPEHMAEVPEAEMLIGEAP